MSAEPAPRFTAVVVTYNSAAVVEGLLDSIPAAVDGQAVETIVVDNDSSDGTADLVERRADCVVLRCPNDGYAAGINRAAEIATSSAPLLVLNPDVRLAPGSVVRMAAALDRPGIGIVAPRTFEPDGSLQRTLRRDPSIARQLGLSFTRRPVFCETCNRPEDYGRAHLVDWAIGAVMLIRRECFDLLGGWDESFFLFSEEVDFCLRARDAGYATWYEAEAVVEHVGKHSGWNANLHTIETINRVRLYRRRHGRAPSTLFWALTLAGEAAKGVRGDAGHRQAAVALLRPSRRPAQLGRLRELIPT